MSVLDVQIIQEDKTFTTFVYLKASFTGVYAHFDSFLPSTCKFDIFTHWLMATFEYTQVGLNYKLN